jgi:hypothetical protein
MAYSYTDAADCLQLVIDLTDIIGTVKEQLIEQNLADSAGKDGSEVVTFRPYFVAARQIQRNRDDVTLKSADGAVFDQLSVMIRSLFEEQIALDSSLGLTVPGAYDAELALERACGCGVPKKPINSVLNRRIMTLETV